MLLFFATLSQNYYIYWMKLQEVTDKAGRKAFHEVARQLYKHDQFWVCPLQSEIEGIFDPGDNSLFKDGDAVRWVLRDDAGKLIGRVAAFYNHDKASKNDQPTGGMGFFECINDRDAAFMLFDACKTW